jgi:predicted nucleotidyltransferase/uncharacterized protein (UPF0332 family)
MVGKKEAKSAKSEKPETLKIINEREIALDFATKVYKKFDKIIKSVVLFGSSAKKTSTPDSDIDIIIITDDVSIRWDEELIAWYREELGKVIQQNPYKKSLHINTVKLSTWWQDLIRGDPIVLNVIRWGDPLIDFGGFFTPLKVLLQEGKIKSTPESIYTLLQRAPTHIARTRGAMLASVDGLYWAVVDSSHAALIAANVMPPSPEHIPEILTQEFVKKGLLKEKYVSFYSEIHEIAKDIIHGKKVEIKGEKIDQYLILADDFMGQMAGIIDKVLAK